MSHTFTKEINYLCKGIGGVNHSQVVQRPMSVEAMFKKLDRLDETQHKLAMKITQTFRKFKYQKVELLPGEEPTLPQGRELTEEDFKYKIKMELDDEAICDLTKSFLLTNSVFGTDYTEQVRAEILTDIGAIYTFGMWLLAEEIAPFFRSLHTT